MISASDSPRILIYFAVHVGWEGRACVLVLSGKTKRASERASERSPPPTRAPARQLPRPFLNRAPHTRAATFPGFNCELQKDRRRGLDAPFSLLLTVPPGVSVVIQVGAHPAVDSRSVQISIFRRNLYITTYPREMRLGANLLWCYCFIEPPNLLWWFDEAIRLDINGALSSQ